MVRHFGLFEFKSNISIDEINQCFILMGNMVDKIPGLLSFEFGEYNSSEGLNDDFTHGFIMTFDNIKSRDLYLPHPFHEKVKDYVVPKLNRVVVFDFVI